MGIMPGLWGKNPFTDIKGNSAELNSQSDRGLSCLYFIKKDIMRNSEYIKDIIRKIVKIMKYMAI